MDFDRKTCGILLIFIGWAAASTKPPSIYVDLGNRWGVIQMLNFRSDYATFENAHFYCKQMEGGELISIHNAEENMALASNILGRTGALWIGLRGDAVGNLSWTDGSPVDYTAWQPRGTSRRDYCTYMNVDEYMGLWATNGLCNANSQGYGYICQIPKEGSSVPTTPPLYECPEQYSLYEGACYRYFKDGLPYAEARESCRRDGAALTSIHSHAENAEVLRMAYQTADQQADHNYTLIGFKRNGSEFVWDDGTFVQLERWGIKRPEMDCACVSVQTTKWNSDECTGSRPYVCKIYKDEAILPIPNIPGTCPDWDYKRWVKQGDYCYYFSLDQGTWRQARDRCLGMGAILSPIHHQSTNDLIFREAKEKNKNSRIWIGYFKSKSGDWVWDDDSEEKYTNWNMNHPAVDTVDAAAISVQYGGDIGRWTSYKSSEIHYYTCRVRLGAFTTIPPNVNSSSCPDRDWITRGSGGEMCYLFLPDMPLTWDEAQKECRVRGGQQANMVTIDTLADNRFIEGALDGTTRLPMEREFWIGLRRIEERKDVWKWKWSDNKDRSWRNWVENERKDQKYNCSSIRSLDGDWYTLPCDSLRGFACQVEKGINYFNLEEASPDTLSTNEGVAVAVTCGVLVGIAIFFVGIYLYQRNQRKKRAGSSDDHVVAYTHHKDDDAVDITSADNEKDEKKFEENGTA